MKTVDEKGIADNTLIIFTSDNGPHRENGGDPEFFKSNGGLRGIKRDLYEGGIRVPFIAYWKGKTQAGTTDRLFALWDLHPTFTELAGLKNLKPVDGISMVSTLNNKASKGHDTLYWEFHDNNGRQAVRWRNWKGVKLNVSKEADAPLELYNLANDPFEKNNVAQMHPEIVTKLRSIINQEHIYNKDWPLLASEK
jgi:arylsulfatase A-like enzyme